MGKGVEMGGAGLEPWAAWRDGDSDARKTPERRPWRVFRNGGIRANPVPNVWPGRLERGGVVASSGDFHQRGDALGQAVGHVLPLAVAIAIFPVPIIAAVLMVGSDRGTTKALAFVLAWCTGLLTVGAVSLLLARAGDANDDGEPATWVSVLLFGLGLLCVVLAVKQWQGRPGHGDETPVPAWMGKIDDFTKPRREQRVSRSLRSTPRTCC